MPGAELIGLGASGVPVAALIALNGRGCSHEREGRALSYEMVGAYMLMLGDEHESATVSVHVTAGDAWRALDREVRERCGLRPRPRRALDPEAVARLADAWRAGDPESRFWQLCPHQLRIMVPEIGRPAVTVVH